MGTAVRVEGTNVRLLLELIRVSYNMLGISTEPAELQRNVDLKAFESALRCALRRTAGATVVRHKTAAANSHPRTPAA